MTQSFGEGGRKEGREGGRDGGRKGGRGGRQGGREGCPDLTQSFGEGGREERSEGGRCLFLNNIFPSLLKSNKLLQTDYIARDVFVFFCMFYVFEILFIWTSSPQIV